MSHDMNEPKLVFFCGKMAAGKSTLAQQVAQSLDAVLLIQDEFLARLYPDEITDIPSFVKYSTRLRASLESHIYALLTKGVSVVLDFPANTTKQRNWFRELFEKAKAHHELHYINASDDLCKIQLRKRSADLPSGSPFTTDAEFDAITTYFQPPSPEEGFNVIEHRRA